MKRFFCGLMCAFLISSFSFASESAASRAEAAATVLNEIMAAPDNGIPVEILDSAKCVAVVPSLVKGGFVVGASHGRGMATCKLNNGSWTAPAPITMTGGSIGFQIGLQGVDLVMMIMNDRGMQALLTNRFKVGADASAAAGPVGRHVEGSTDWKLRAEVLTYSRARGLFAGVTINGSTISQDEDATRELYGKFVPFKTILTGATDMPRGGGEPFVAAVRKAVATANNSGNASSTPVNPPPRTPPPAPAATPAPVSTPMPAPATESTPAPPASPTPPPMV
ncbi:MAG TPA: lipid-binding SYLF domain-containing protein [Candidatus Angelobacter sp.]|nr:lipid-binding SYLF domain-containing protein [Candidatus Angelobacter sp.]